MMVANETIKQILNTFDDLKAANSQFKQCQASAFKAYANTVLEAPLVNKAYDELRTALAKDDSKGKKE